jgi:tight adherence protein B
MSSGAQVFIIMVFVTVVLLMQGLIVPAFGESAKMRKRLKNRINEIESGGDGEAFSSLLRQKYLKSLSPLERRLESLPAMENLARKIEQSGHKILAYRLVLISIVMGVATLIASYAHFRLPIAAFGLGAMSAYLPFMKISMDRTKRMSAFEEQLPDAIDTMKRALRAGHPLSAALKFVADEMDNPVAAEFELTFGDINYGNDVRRAMLALLSRVPSVTVMAFLENISGVIRGRFRFQRKVKTYSAEGRMSAWVLAMVPLVLFVTLWIVTPDYLPYLLEDPRGINMIIYGCISGVAGIFWIRKILRIEV